ncbi:ABC-type spermidine/putrescine transport system permease component II [Rubrobacter radiotolerans]|uniref:ABC transporter permease subunit n=1 Tax=Rubrobacter radiotolerans TaxID=42256 RepID=A0A023X5G7_RUBRA|nr:ABC transporter permease subunit [Rubrobacter radiotolerans]AHY47319.1 ABC-type spermidine/putrescine transport system permease component II [Rubrobacter radiotolerans]MDX5894723.1 ABC transporter permease subunit [Rubrobacter radiotolerans]SMC06613.1 putative spermidine/putrescine transport system permease protein [Rubrobacter radiotolerans DSM 5868]
MDKREKARRAAVRGLLALLVALPFAPILLWSFAGEWRFPDLLPTEWSLRGWDYVLGGGGRVPEAVANSLAVALAAALVAVAVGLPAGMALGGYEWRLKGVVIFFVLLPVLVPPLASTMGIHLTFIRLGLTDTLFGVFLVHLVPTVPYTAIIMTSVFAERTGELEEAARTLGASPWQAFVRVTLPDVAPGVAVAGLFAFLISWSQYILTVLIGGGNVVTLPMLLFASASGTDSVITSVLALVFALPAVLVLVATLRFLGPAGHGRYVLTKPRKDH